MSKKVCPYCGSKNLENKESSNDNGMSYDDYWICLDCGKEGFVPTDSPILHLEDIVPSFHLCRNIPKGCFSDSVVIWEGNKTYLRSLMESHCGKIYPAPTAEEIMIDIHNRGNEVLLSRVDPFWFTTIQLNRNFTFYGGTGDCHWAEDDKMKGTDALLRLWMKIYFYQRDNEPSPYPDYY